jgi:hypothetical protein
MASKATSTIVKTAPLYGVDLATPVVLAPAGLPDRDEALEPEKEAHAAVSAWKRIADYSLPPLLDPGRTDLAESRDRLAEESVALLEKLQAVAAQRGTRDRGFQRKTLYATTTAEFRVPAGLPEALQTGPFQPGAALRGIVRFSSAGPKAEPDTQKDQRAVGIRITDDRGHVQDLLFTSGAAGNHARDARQFNSSMQAAIDMAEGGIGGTLKGLFGLLRREGLRETLRLRGARSSASDVGVSLAALSYYSRSPLEMGSKLVHLALIPIEGTPAALAHEARGARDGLGRDLCMRRTAGHVRFRVVAAEAPSLGDLSEGPAGPWFTVAELRLPKQSTGEAEMRVAAAQIHGELAMHPFNVWAEGVLTPRGELNEVLRRPVYARSALNSGRSDTPPKTPQYRI